MMPLPSLIPLSPLGRRAGCGPMEWLRFKTEIVLALPPSSITMKTSVTGNALAPRININFLFKARGPAHKHGTSELQLPQATDTIYFSYLVTPERLLRRTKDKCFYFVCKPRNVKKFFADSFVDFVDLVRLFRPLQ